MYDGVLGVRRDILQLQFFFDNLESKMIIGNSLVVVPSLNKNMEGLGFSSYCVENTDIEKFFVLSYKYAFYKSDILDRKTKGQKTDTVITVNNTGRVETPISYINFAEIERGYIDDGLELLPYNIIKIKGSLENRFILLESRQMPLYEMSITAIQHGEYIAIGQQVMLPPNISLSSIEDMLDLDLFVNPEICNDGIYVDFEVNTMPLLITPPQSSKNTPRNHKPKNRTSVYFN